MLSGRSGMVNKRVLARAIGYCSSCCLALPNGKFHLVSLYRDLHSKKGWGKNVNVRLHNKSENELKYYWLRPPLYEVGRSWFPPTKNFNIFSVLITDASKYAWGAHL